jgi:hypothetical protein
MLLKIFHYLTKNVIILTENVIILMENVTKALLFCQKMGNFEKNECESQI